MASVPPPTPTTSTLLAGITSNAHIISLKRGKRGEGEEKKERKGRGKNREQDKSSEKKVRYTGRKRRKRDGGQDEVDVRGGWGVEGRGTGGGDYGQVRRKKEVNGKTRKNKNTNLLTL